eukprot:CAMPEP_0206055054 /NCGR_PEP_ID=MMETSP1466-20131121/39324_1 /ASSEMBLY_ACC=CAM_ASM_001126 /TAXON_ID=44452 /ORGANISM="Pavlova gyrans, Strain CCMP608" /LENGTH=63 /DNA_ID=CAMNT_0053430275 /DNA_START=1 /DNA_END=188 /DNA_ORIENTATION=+
MRGISPRLPRMPSMPMPARVAELQEQHKRHSRTAHELRWGRFWQRAVEAAGGGTPEELDPADR